MKLIDIDYQQDAHIILSIDLLYQISYIQRWYQCFKMGILLHHPDTKRLAFGTKRPAICVAILLEVIRSIF